MKRLTLVLVVCMLAMIMGKGVMYSKDVNADLQSKLILKMIAYDRNLARFGDPIKIGVSSKAMLDALQKNGQAPIKGKKLSVAMLGSVGDIGNFGIIYADKNWKKDYGAACAAAIDKKILMFCNSYEAVENNQAGIAFRVVGNKPKIVLNIGVSKNQGTDFPSNLLKLTLVVGNLK
ncbi:MAG: YfiR family protein [bacterium]|nr:YfiR family protein [bacterium]